MSDEYINRTAIDILFGVLSCGGISLNTLFGGGISSLLDLGSLVGGLGLSKNKLIIRRSSGKICNTHLAEAEAAAERRPDIFAGGM